MKALLSRTLTQAALFSGALFSGALLSGALLPASSLAATGEITAELLHTDADGAQFGQYSDLQDSGTHFRGGFDLTGKLPWSDRGYWSAEAANLGLQTYDFSYELREPHRYKISLTLDGSQQFKRDDGLTPFFKQSGNNLGLPANWVAGSSTSDMTAFSSTAREFDQEVKRDAIFLDVTFYLNTQWQLDASVHTSKREGTQAKGAAVYYDASTAFAAILPVEIDEDSSSVSVQLNFSGERLVQSVSLLYSEFDNQVGQLIWANPYSGTGNADVDYPVGRASLAASPDNERQQLQFSGSYLPRIAPGLSIQWNGAWDQVEQDDLLAPYTVNPLLSVADPLPTSRSENNLDVFTGGMRLSYRPRSKSLRNLQLRANYFIDDRDYNKDRIAFNYVRGDASDQPGALSSIYSNAHDYQQERTLAGADYRLPWLRSKISLEYEYDVIERQNAAVDETETDTYRGVFRFSLGNDVMVRVDGSLSDRNASTYQWDRSFLTSRTADFINQTPVDQRYNNHPALSQFHFSDAETDELKLNLTYSGLSAWFFSVNLQWKDIDYNDTELGLTRAESSFYGLDIQYSPSSNITGYGNASWSGYESRAAGRSFGGGIEKAANRVTPPLPEASDPTRNWRMGNKDEVVTISAGLTWKISERLDVDANYTWVDSESSFDTKTGGAGDLDTTPLPDVDTELHSLTLSADFSMNERTSMTLTYQYFDFEETDWARQNVSYNSVSNLLSPGEPEADETVNLFAIALQYQF